MALERVPERVALGARLDVDGEVAVGDRSAAAAVSRRYPMMLAERAGQSAELVVGLDGDVLVDFTLGEPSAASVTERIGLVSSVATKTITMLMKGSAR